MGARPKLPRRYWTAEEDARLVRFIADKVSRTEAASILGRTEKAVSDRASYLGLRFDSEAALVRKKAALVRFATDPAYAAARKERVKRGWSDERRAAMSAHAKEHFTARILHASSTPEARARSAALTRKRAAAKLAWCPPEKLAEYRRLSKSFPAKEARRLIEATMTRHERALSRVRGGAAIMTRPILAANDYDYSLVGSALA